MATFDNGVLLSLIHRLEATILQLEEQLVAAQQPPSQQPPQPDPAEPE